MHSIHNPNNQNKKIYFYFFNIDTLITYKYFTIYLKSLLNFEKEAKYCISTIYF